MDRLMCKPKSCQATVSLKYSKRALNSSVQSVSRPSSLVAAHLPHFVLLGGVSFTSERALFQNGILLSRTVPAAMLRFSRPHHGPGAGFSLDTGDVICFLCPATDFL